MTLLQGNALTVLSTLPDESVNCCITSPPYWGLRDYGTGQWSGGLPDCDHTYQHGVQGTTGQRADRTFTAQAVYRDTCRKCGAIRVDDQIGLERTPGEFIEKLVAVFREVRRVLRSNGTLWINIGDSYATGAGAVGSCPGGGKRGEAWKANYRGNHTDDPKRTKVATAMGPMTQPNRMPIEGLKPKDLVGIPWMLAFALRADGWWLRQDIIWHKPNPMPESIRDRCTKAHEYIFLLSKSRRYWYDAAAIKEQSSDGTHAPGTRTGNGGKHRPSPNGFVRDKHSYDVMPETRNKRSVWVMLPTPTPDAHFATFPIELPETCLLAGCPDGGTVLDPFSGAGTTGLACLKHGRRYIGIELKPEYIQITRDRAARHYPLLAAGVAS